MELKNQIMYINIICTEYKHNKHNYKNIFYFKNYAGKHTNKYIT